eukprot:TRINITY_DN30775_c0_g1_i1.p1 TRINITY_DN30775_c0_g1~~TRINITY_DN30775_c0_g1_i1.p1  ORF type:complete len:225 (-),score=42.93 TRINITY_DN30775_c0_g1_i1:4-654(-)
MADDPNKVELVVVGPVAVGKSSVTINFVQHLFPTNYDPTIQDTYSKQADVDGDVAFLEIIDTAGQEDLWVLSEPFLRSGEGFLLVFSLTDAASFENLLAFRDKILKVKELNSVPAVLVGNKADLRDQRVVSHEAATTLAQTFFPTAAPGKQAVPFFEVSAKERVNVDEAFLELVRQVRLHRAAAPSAPAQAQAPTQGQHREAAPVKKKKSKKCTIL